MSKEEYDEVDWNGIPREFIAESSRERWSVAQIESRARAVLAMKYTCTDCKEEEEYEEDMRISAILYKHGVEFYNFTKVFELNQDYRRDEDETSELLLTYSKTIPTDLAGTYDIIFQRGNHYGVDIESRTTKGTAVLEEDVAKKTFSGRVEFHPELQVSDIVSFQHDFTLENGKHDFVRIDTPDGFWRCLFKAYLVDEDAKKIVQGENSRTAYLISITNQSAIPLMKYEYYGEEEEACSSENMVMFETLEEAKNLMKKHEERQSCKNSWLVRHKGLPAPVAQLVRQFVCNVPKPVLFLEPGDLVLTVNWSGSFHPPHCYTDTVLRKRK